MSSLKAAIIGCGKRAPGFAQACLDAGDVELVGVADPREEAAEELARRFGGKAFSDTAQMLEKTRPQFVCIITRPSVRLAPIRACAEAGVRGVHCEKPMSTSWGEARAIRECAESAGMKVTFSHQRRLLARFQGLRRLLREGIIGRVERIEGYCDNFYDWGTHWFDMMFFLNDQEPADWLMAQADRHNPKFVFDQPMDTAGICTIHFRNDVFGLMFTGRAQSACCRIRVLGEDGMLDAPPGKDGQLRMLRAGGPGSWEVVETPGTNEGASSVAAGTADAITCLREERTSTLDSRNALMATELVFATYRSSMSGGPIELPLVGDVSLQEVFGT